MNIVAKNAQILERVTWNIKSPKIIIVKVIAVVAAEIILSKSKSSNIYQM